MKEKDYGIILEKGAIYHVIKRFGRFESVELERDSTR